MKETRDYGMFKFRDDNRKIENRPLNKLKASIQAHNLLHLRPIIVNADMEIIDGQHRLTAAKELGLSIYYEIREELKGEDIILMQIAKAWAPKDYFNYYCKNHYPEYLKLESFMKKNGIELTTAMVLLSGGNHQPKEDFRKGKFIFKNEVASESLDLCWQTRQTIERLLGPKQWTESTKFWRAMMIIFRHPNFDQSMWFKNLEMLIAKVTQKVSIIDYVSLFKEIHNFRNRNRIEDLEVTKGEE